MTRTSGGSGQNGTSDDDDDTTTALPNSTIINADTKTYARTHTRWET